MTICFELEGGARNGKLQGIEASMQYLLTNGGELGRSFWLAPAIVMEHWFSRDTFDGAQSAERYRIFDRAQQGDRILIKARLLPSPELACQGQPSAESAENSTVCAAPSATFC